ncbi:MAG: hypothetical protein CM15mV90_090 [uncultured marine virus]|nr:MAG: hypothetical protein CM15mV90_090 [uncultured marine virus]
MTPQFEITKYAIDIYYKGKVYGSMYADQPDREVFGYGGRQQVKLADSWVYKNKKLKRAKLLRQNVCQYAGAYKAARKIK